MVRHQPVCVDGSEQLFFVFLGGWGGSIKAQKHGVSIPPSDKGTSVRTPAA